MISALLFFPPESLDLRDGVRSQLSRSSSANLRFISYLHIPGSAIHLIKTSVVLAVFISGAFCRPNQMSSSVPSVWKYISISIVCDLWQKDFAS